MIFTKEQIEQIRESLIPSDIVTLLNDIDAEPRFQSEKVIVSRTVCHSGDSRKLYYYIETKTFHCYTNCGTFDVFDLVRKVYDISFIEAVHFIVNKFGINVDFYEEEDFNDSYNIYRKAEEKYFNSHKNDEKEESKNKTETTRLKEYDKEMLSNFIYPIIAMWEREGIGREIIKDALVGYYPGGGQITIPHFDKDGRLVGIRGRHVGQEEAAIFGKYRPLYVNGQIYNHPLGFNLYNLNNSKNNIGAIGKAIVFEGEKSALLYRTYFGVENDISVASCGSSLSDFQVQLLMDAGAKEIIIAFDRQFQELNDDEFKQLTKKYYQLNDRYKSIVAISFIFDKNKITGYKSSPIDEGPDKFLKLFKERIKL